MRIFIDIETLPTTDAEVINQLRSSVKAPAQYKKQESIDEWMQQNAETATQEAVKATSFSGLYGSIACICFAIEENGVQSVDCLRGEDKMLESFFTKLEGEIRSARPGAMNIRPSIIGHNVYDFDLPFIKHRSMILGVRPPAFMLNIMNASQYDSSIQDTMLMWSRDKQKRISMDKLCKAFGIEGKGDFDGSMVADTWPVNPEKVIEYCKQDVERTRQIYKRITFNDTF